MRVFVGLLAALALLLAACAEAGDAISTSSTTNSEREPTGLEGDPRFVATVEHAVAVNIASDGDAAAVVAAITHDDVSVWRVDLSSGRLGERTSLSDGVIPIAHPIERPAVRVGPDGDVDVAFTSFVGDGATVFFSDGMTQPAPISGSPRPETNLVHMTTAPDGKPLLTWLEDSTLSVAGWVGDGLVESEDVDDLTCDCCNPVPVFTGDYLVVAYRDRDTVDGEIVRNVAAVRSRDGGATYEPPVQIADDDWFLSGCPFTGPDIVEIDGTLVVAWMDARQSIHPDQSDSTIWVDRSSDGGATFGADMAVASDGRHHWPAMTVDEEGIIHLVWETQGPDGGLSYAWSGDDGRSFSDPTLLVDREMSGGNAPASPSAVYHDGHLLVTWADGRQGYVAGWPLG